jgi:phosphatidylglycerophosphatase C
MRTVAVFDFDKTLSTRDNVMPFLRHVVGTRRLAVALVMLSPRLAAAALLDRRRSAAKSALVRRLLAGSDDAGLTAQGERFAAEIVARHLRPEALQRVEWHRGQGHDLVIVSASFSHYVEPVGRALGFAAVLATELEVGPDGRLTGGLRGENVRRAEKVQRLDAWLGDRPAFVWAYGDSKGDRELFARADRAVRIR